MREKMKILIVEDDGDLRDVLEEMLVDLDCHCVKAENGEKALQLLEKEDFTCVISDIRMPKMDGMTLLEKMDQSQIHTPVIMITGFNEYTDEIVVKQGGVAVIHKPFSYDQIKEIVEHYIELL